MTGQARDVDWPKLHRKVNWKLRRKEAQAGRKVHEEDCEDAVSDGIVSVLAYWQPKYEDQYSGEQAENYRAQHATQEARRSLRKERKRKRIEHAEAVWDYFMAGGTDPYEEDQRKQAEVTWNRLLTQSDSDQEIDRFLEAEYALVLHFVDELEKPLRRIVEGLYWYDLPMSEVAALVGYSRRQTERLHREALETLKANLRFWMPAGILRPEAIDDPFVEDLLKATK